MACIVIFILRCYHDDTNQHFNVVSKMNSGWALTPTFSVHIRQDAQHLQSISIDLDTTSLYSPFCSNGYSLHLITDISLIGIPFSGTDYSYGPCQLLDPVLQVSRSVHLHLTFASNLIISYILKQIAISILLFVSSYQEKVRFSKIGGVLWIFQSEIENQWDDKKMMVRVKMVQKSLPKTWKRFFLMWFHDAEVIELR